MPEPFTNGRATWLIDGEEDPASVSPWLFWITVSVIVGAAAGYVLWRVFR